MKNRFNWQSFISIGLLFAFILMMISGIILYVAPEGSLSRWIGWDVLSLTKKQWEQQHTIFSYLFVLFSLLHIFKINWGFLISYFSVKFKTGFLKEIIVAFAIVVVVFVGTLLSWQPFNFVITWGGEISDSYSVGIDYPSINDAEKLSLDDFATKVFNISYSDFKTATKKYDFKGVNENTKVMDFCKMNGITPEEFYSELKSKLVTGGGDDLADRPDISSINSFLDNKITIL